jgi:demethylmenaquinone methyltransferase/2-methoxy-6-polyprenyl-1,4-benzoquinol methylase
MSGATGATPPGASGEQEAARWVRGMFGSVAHRYDLLNHVLSLNIDRHWRRQTVKRVRPFLSRPGARVLDLCCGTGDLLIALERAAGRPLVGGDFCHPMLVEAGRKLTAGGLRSSLIEADALTLPFPDASLDLVTAAFGFRNLANYRKGLAELRRVLRSGGAAGILEFSQPRVPGFAAMYRLYSGRLLPFIGGLISGDRTAYTYLPESVRKFPGPEELARQMSESGFSRVRFERMTGGIVALHIGIVS